MNEHKEKIPESGLSFFSHGQGGAASSNSRTGTKKPPKTVAFLDKQSSTPVITFEKVYAQIFSDKESPKLPHLSCIKGPHATDVEINKAWVNKHYPVETFDPRNDIHPELVVSWMICLRETANDAVNFDRLARGALALLKGSEHQKNVRLILRITDAEYTHNIAKQRLSAIVDGASDFHITNSPRTCLEAHGEYRAEARAVGQEWIESVKLSEAEERLGCKITVLLGEDIDSNLRGTFLKKLQRPFLSNDEKRPPLDVTKLARFVQDEFSRQNGFQRALTPQLNERGARDKREFGVHFNTVASQNCNIAYLLDEIIRHMVLLYTIGDLIDIAFAPDTFIPKRQSSEKNPTPKFYDILDNWSRWLLTSFCKKEGMDINFQTNENLLTFIRAEYNPDKLSRKLSPNTPSSQEPDPKDNHSNTTALRKPEPAQAVSPITKKANDNTPIFEMARRLVVDEAQKRLQEAGQLDPVDTQTVVQFLSVTTLMAEESRHREEETKRQNAQLEKQIRELTQINQQMRFLPPPRTEPVAVAEVAEPDLSRSNIHTVTTTNMSGSPN